MTESFYSRTNSVHIAVESDATVAHETRSRVRAVSTIRTLAYGMAAATLFLMALGSATRVMNAGLSCPDWPLCFGQLVPREQMDLRVFLEWFHRLIATSMGLFVILLVSLSVWWRRLLPGWVPNMALAALALVLVQGMLGGLTVTQLLRFDIVTAHLGTGLLFFSTLLALGALLTPFQGRGSAGKFAWVAATATGLVYLQSLMGGVVASRWALHLCFGDSQLCSVMNAHIGGVFPATITTVVLVVMAWHAKDLHPWLRNLGSVAALLIALQISLGVATFKLHLQVEPLTVAHQAVGAMLLGTLVATSVLAWRDRAAGTSNFDVFTSNLSATDMAGDRA
ncbi:MAG: heme A synthase [Cyanobacteria bacterium P01_F01_bin.33]